MGTRLMKLKLVYSKKELSDGKTIGGKGRLTDSLIDKLAHYYDLSHPALLKKCLGGKTQNPNESLNSLIWKFCPKTIGSRLQIAEIAANLETSVFNDGNQILISILEKFGLKIYRNVCVSLAERDNRRIFTSRQRCLQSSFEARRPKKIKKSKEIELFQEQEGNHQMVRIAHHNDESVREGYITNGGKKVKLFTRALKAFQCNNRIVMAQKEELGDFLRGRIIGQLEFGRTRLEVSEELESPRVSSPGFGNDSKMMVM
ncbi:uncharacterized protein TNCV_2317931 [Trichonephila clavipes]|nr:uncharacterized protein TNCV_2317931 [Trichonephila clavipes]